MADKRPPYADSADAVAEKLQCDVLFFNGPIGRPFDWQLTRLCGERTRRKTVLLLLVTGGGDPDAAYRIARCLQDKYERFVCLVPGYCKSAGTIIALGANELVIADAGELGPLDVQMSKQDELFQRQSGLTTEAALETLHEKAYEAFEHFVIQVVTRTGVSTRAAMQVAVQLTTGLFSHTYSHVDPMHVGEAGRAMKIAQKYGELLQQKSLNFDADTLSALAREYPSHGFIIDRDEAKRLFKNVRAPHAEEEALLEKLGQIALVPQSSPDQLFMAYLSTASPTATAAPAFAGITPAGDQHEAVAHDQTQTSSQPSNDTASSEHDPGEDSGAPERHHVAEVRPISGGARSGNR
jgi:hypothetical protein